MTEELHIVHIVNLSSYLTIIELEFNLCKTILEQAKNMYNIRLEQCFRITISSNALNKSG